MEGLSEPQLMMDGWMDGSDGLMVGRVDGLMN
jgi:hypothetical protein